ncbi:hypothetical protein KI387_019119, partial [Taxus chinensis]
MGAERKARGRRQGRQGRLLADGGTGGGQRGQGRDRCGSRQGSMGYGGGRRRPGAGW